MTPRTHVMSPAAVLVGRESIVTYSHQSLTTVVDRMLSSRSTQTTDNQNIKDLYSIVISRKNELTITKILKPDVFVKNLSNDEGFESDIDSISLLSSDGDSGVSVTNQVKNRELQVSDSANSSSASDSSDTETVVQKIACQQTNKTETYKVDNLICYTNVRFPKIIGFVVKKDGKSEFIIFEFLNSEQYDRIRYAFNSIASAATNKNVTIVNNNNSNNSTSPKFNLVHRTDKNGVTHIEISRESNNSEVFPQTTEETSSIISINTPDVDTRILPTCIHHENVQPQPKFNLNLLKIRANSHANLLTETRLHNDLVVKQSSKPIGLKSRSNSHADLLDETSYKVPFTLNTFSRSRSNSHADLLNDTISKTVNEIADRRSVQEKIKHEIDCIIRADIDTENIESKKSNKILNVNLYKPASEEPTLRKVWRSAEDILDSEKSPEPPKKPERRKKVKGKAPPPPNVMKGQYVRVSVDPNKKIPEQPSTSSQTLKLATFDSNKLRNYNSNWVYVESQPSSLVLTTVINPQPIQQKTPTYESFKNNSSEFRTEFVDHRAYTLNRKNKEAHSPRIEHKWTNSVPRMPKMTPRSRSENRNSNKNNPYKYVDTTLTTPYYFTTTVNNNCTNSKPQYSSVTNFSLPNTTNNFVSPNTISNRLFGLSQKLKEFGSNVVSTNHKFANYDQNDTLHRRRSSLGEISYKTNNVSNVALTTFNNSRYASDSNSSNLKSVIKKQNEQPERKVKNNNEKKVTFSAFATVQVV